MEKLKKELQELSNEELNKKLKQKNVPVVEKAAIRAVLTGRTDKSNIDKQNKNIKEWEAKTKKSMKKNVVKKEPAKVEEKPKEKAVPKVEKKEVPVKKKGVVKTLMESMIDTPQTIEEVANKLHKEFPDRTIEQVTASVRMFFDFHKRVARLSVNGRIEVIWNEKSKKLALEVK